MAAKKRQRRTRPATTRKKTRSGTTRHVPRSTGRTKSKLAVVKSPVKRRFNDRFQKFYYLHRDDLNRRRRALYNTHKRSGTCVKCNLRRTGKSIFCARHLRLSRVYNRRR